MMSTELKKRMERDLQIVKAAAFINDLPQEWVEERSAKIKAEYEQQIKKNKTNN